MFCIAALLVFSILGIFSATHRKLAKEALDCVFRRVTFRPCVSGFREKVQAKILGTVMTRSVKLAKFLNKYFEVLSWIFLILMVWSTIWVARGGYNYYMYGNCNGLNASGFCVFDINGDNNKVSQISNEKCSLNPPTETDLTMNGVDVSLFPSRNPNGKNEVFFIGCYSCDYTRKTYALIKNLLNDVNVHLIFAHFPVKSDTQYLSVYDYCANKLDPAKFWDFNDKIFSMKIADVDNHDVTLQAALQSGYDKAQFQSCIADPASQKAVDQQFEMIKKTNIYGTPTIFINKQSLVGPKPYRVYERMLGHAFWERWFQF
jgi:type 1 fimbria pilin